MTVIATLWTHMGMVALELTVSATTLDCQCSDLNPDRADP